METPVTSSAVPQVVIQSGSGPLWRFLAIVGWFGFVGCAVLVIGQFAALGEYFDTTSGITEKYHSGSKIASSKVAIIDISGLIVDGGGYIKKQIDRVRDDDAVKAVVVRVDSPGGTITGSDYIYHHLNKLREDRQLPLIVSMGSVAASGGYYVAMAVGDQKKCIYAEPMTTTGSIGVIIPHYDLSGLLARFDVKDDSIASHPYKQMLSMTRPTSPDQRKILERYLAVAFNRFKEIVQAGRPAFESDEAALERLATGEMFTASQAKENGLIDEIGFVEDAVDRALALAGLSRDKARVVQYERPVTLFDLSGMVTAPRDPDARINTLLEMSVPRPYYLCTSLPPLVATYVSH